MAERMEKSSIDASLLSLGDDEISFFQMQTGINDIEQLEQHILRVQAEAYEAYPYPCIRRFLFTKLWITHLLGYQHALQLAKTRENAILVDIGCCFGHDIRAIVADGFPIENVLGLDLKRELWEIGNKLFNSNSTSFSVPFIAGNIFDNRVIDMESPVPLSSQTPSLHDLKDSLNSLRGHVSVIHISMVFHLFSEEKQLELAHRLKTLLSPLPGSIIFGHHIGLPAPGFHTNNLSGLNMYCHSPDSWCALWDGVVFEKGSVEAEARLVPSEEFKPSSKAVNGDPVESQGRDTTERWRATTWMQFSIKRVRIV
ncbi:hypothetical protein K439DRAFT_1628186 [Ramaria rubella]|nr:hypothetical protein K439DRAFT_1628186 [Ramaria rubella]